MEARRNMGAILLVALMIMMIGLAYGFNPLDIFLIDPLLLAILGVTAGLVISLMMQRSKRRR